MACAIVRSRKEVTLLLDHRARSPKVLVPVGVAAAAAMRQSGPILGINSEESAIQVEAVFIALAPKCCASSIVVWIRQTGNRERLEVERHRAQSRVCDKWNTRS